MHSLEDTQIRFDIDPSHSLHEQNREQHEKDQSLYEVCWFLERDPQQQLVARYRCWIDQTKQYPYRTQVGWERYSPSGALLDREVYYSKLEQNQTLH